MGGEEECWWEGYSLVDGHVLGGYCPGTGGAFDVVALLLWEPLDGHSMGTLVTGDGILDERRSREPDWPVRRIRVMGNLI